MDRKLVAASLAAVAATVLGGIVITGGGLALLRTPLSKACIAALELRLKAPSTLRILEINEYAEPASRADLENALRKKIGKYGTETESTVVFALQMYDAAEAAGDPQAVTWHDVFLKTDAENGMGVPIRSTHHCRHLSIDGSKPASNGQSVELDGMSYYEWLNDLIKSGNG